MSLRLWRQNRKRHINHGCLELPRTEGTPAPCLAPTLCGGRSPPSSSGCSPSCQAEPRINFSLFGPNSTGLRVKRHVPQAPEAKMPKERNSGTLCGVTQGPLQGQGGAGLVALCLQWAVPSWLPQRPRSDDWPVLGLPPSVALKPHPPAPAIESWTQNIRGTCLALPGFMVRARRGGGGGSFPPLSEGQLPASKHAHLH